MTSKQLIPMLRSAIARSEAYIALCKHDSNPQVARSVANERGKLEAFAAMLEACQATRPTAAYALSLLSKPTA